MSDRSVDILLISYQRPRYTRLALDRLLETADEDTRIWLWHNGDDAATWSIVRAAADHPRVHRVHRSDENVGLGPPTSWLWREAGGAYLSKVDDDCLVPPGWLDTLREAHAAEPRFGVLGCWRFAEEDFDPVLAAPKIRTVAGGHRVLENCWVEGSGYLMKRPCIERVGPLRAGESFTRYCIRIARAGWINGWRYPFLRQEHMDDPRAPHSLLRTDADLQRHLPLSAAHRGTRTLDAWTDQLRRSARIVQAAPTDPRVHGGLRRRVRRLWTRVQGRELQY